MMKPNHQIAVAFRTVALRLEQAIEAGRRSNHINAEDLRETLLAVADLLDPPMLTACPGCGETDVDNLVWTDDEVVSCQSCGGEFRPAP